MLKQYLKITVRALKKDKVYTSINITGLAVAVACCFLLLFWIKFELSYDNDQPNAGRIYRLLKVEERNGGPHRSLGLRPSINEQLEADFPGVEAATFLSRYEMPVVIEGNQGDGVMLCVGAASLSFIRMFPLVYTEGSPQSVKKQGGCIISHKAAQKLFGQGSAVGKSITVYDINWTIDAVVEIPENTHLGFDILTFAQHALDPGTHYILVQPNADMNALNKQLKQYPASRGQEKIKFELQPLRGVHLHSPEEVAVNSSFETYGDLKQIYLFSLVALLILLIAVINYVNTSIARTMKKMKEIGLRKVVGATQGQLIERFIFESFLITLVAVVLAFVPAAFFFRSFSSLMGNQVGFVFDLQAVFIAVALIAVITLLSGGYAAFYLSSLNPVLVLRGGSQTGSKDGLRKVLLGVQFFLSTAVVLCTVFIYRQLFVVLNTNTGVDRANILVLETGAWYEVESYIQELKKIPEVIEASIAGSAPYNAVWGYSGIRWEGCTDQEVQTEFTEISCDSHYAAAFGLQVIQGEFIPPGLTWWQFAEAESFNIVINETFKRLIGLDNPIGVTVNYGNNFNGKVIGVVKDFNFRPLNQKISPLIISFNPEQCFNLYIKTTGGNQQAVQEQILHKHMEMKPDWSKQPVVYYTVDDEYKQMYRVELRTAGILTVFSSIAFVLSLMGIVSMVSFMVERRTKEIAIRKINGALLKDIVLLFLLNFGRTGVIASVMAIPLCYAILHHWLQNYVYRTPLAWWVFVGIPVLLLSIAAFVMSVQVYGAAIQNPVKSLRNE